MNQEAYVEGVRIALCDAGLLKTAAGPDEAGSTAWPVLFGPIGGAAAAPRGKGWEAFGKTWLGGALGGLGGMGGGAGLGALISAIASKGKVHPEAVLAGLGLGGMAGGMAGSGLGYQSAVQ